MTWTTRPRSKGAGDLSYCREGQGPSLVLVHGVGLRAEAWNAVSRLLADRFTVHCIDMPGHGESLLAGASTLDHFVARCRAFVDALRGPVFLAGHSMGAMIALELAAQAQSKIAGVAALNAIYRRSESAAQAVSARAKDVSTVGASKPDETLARWFGSAPQGRNAQAAVACRRWLEATDPVGYATAYRIFAAQDGPADETLARMQGPALFQTGSQDPNSTPGMSREMASKVPAGRVVIVDGAAHMTPMTHPDEVARALASCFSEQVAE